MQLLSELTYPFHLTYNIFPFFLVTSPLRSLITYVHGTVFLILLITKTSSDLFGVQPFPKMFCILIF